MRQYIVTLLASALLVASALPHDSHNHNHQPQHQLQQQPQHHQGPQPATSPQQQQLQQTATTEQTGKILPVPLPVPLPSQSVRPARHLLHSDNDDSIYIDLSHPLENKTLHWPTNSGFEYLSQTDGERTSQFNETYYLKSDAFKMAVHCGTHLDAPRHFSKSSWTVEEIPLDRLINVPVKVIDLSAKVAANRTYNFVKEDFIDSNSNKSLVSPKSVVLVYTGISQSYDKGQAEYMGTELNDTSKMRIPGFSKGAAEYLAEVGIYGVGLDAASADSSERHAPGHLMDPAAHVVFNSKQIYILENISQRLAELLKQEGKDIRLVIAPLAIVGGSGSPIRLVAAVSSHHEETDCSHQKAASIPNSASGLEMTGASITLMSVVSWLSMMLVQNRPL